MKIGALELVVIFIVALLVIGPDKLPQYARRLGKAIREFRAGTADVTQEIRESVIDPLQEAQKPLREAMEPLEEMDLSFKSSLKSMENDLKSLGKARSEPKKSAAAPSSGGTGSAEAPAEAAPEKEGESSV